MIKTSSPLRIAFMGSPDFAAVALRPLHDAGHQIVAVYSQPPKPVGRGHQIQKTAVHQLADELGIMVRTPKTLRDETAQQEFRDLQLDIAVVAAYGLILPKAVLDAPRHGCLNIHASLLPRWRGAAPIQRAILAGDTETGIAIMQMDVGLDTGDVLAMQSLPITNATTTPALHDALAALGGMMIVRSLDDVAAGRAVRQPQPTEGVTYAAKLTREDGRIDWTKPAAEIERQVRALHPWPGCFFTLGGETIKLLSCAVVDGVVQPEIAPATLLDDQMTIACGQGMQAGALRLLTVQRAGKASVDGASFLRGARLSVGMVLA